MVLVANAAMVKWGTASPGPAASVFIPEDSGRKFCRNVRKFFVRLHGVTARSSSRATGRLSSGAHRYARSDLDAGCVMEPRLPFVPLLGLPVSVTMATLDPNADMAVRAACTDINKTRL